MDSLTQIVLGAAVGEAVLGRKIGNKALLYGAIAGTIPDLDVLASNFTDTVSALAIHRGFTHSIVFSVVFGAIFGWIVSKYEKYKDFKGWFWLFFLGFLTHPILDSYTTWGTQLFWPLDTRLAYKSIFVIDPLYTVPFLICVILVLFQKRTSPKRRFYNNLGLKLSSAYLLITFILKGLAYHQFEKALTEQGITYKQLETRPSPMNTILWSANIERENDYLIGNYSFFDSQPISFVSYPKNHELLGTLIENDKIQQMIGISKGWFTISKKNNELFYNDLRFGLLSFNPDSQDFVFRYKIVKDNNGVSLIEARKSRGEASKLLSELWQRIKGN